MIYFSTRNASPPASLKTALLDGLAPDGGLYLPEQLMPLPDGWQDAPSLAGLGAHVLAPFVADTVPNAEALVRDALNFETPLVRLDDDLFVLELFHGPTLSFKDVGARTLARFAHALLEPGERLTILVATSGDTGSAVADGFSGLPGVRVVLLFPEGRVSEVQERQLAIERPGVTPVRVRGTFDDCQRLVKTAFEDVRFRAHGRLSSANSINIGRLLPQSLYYLDAVRQLGDTPRFVVPSGNLGNLTAGVMAHRAGMPAAGFVAAHNANRGFADFLAGDDLRPADTVQTLSNAMDVGRPSNAERLTALLPLERLRALVRGTVTDDATTRASIRDAYDRYGYLACPHTAVGLDAVRRLRDEGASGPMVVLSTAHPAKFPDVVAEATGATPPEPEALARLRGLPDVAVTVEPTLDALHDAAFA
ncbi:MAG: threonine synthase [Bacteroidetes bacterium]|nr:threonine synthase [Bacteroidota bacterium]